MKNLVIRILKLFPIMGALLCQMFVFSHSLAYENKELPSQDELCNKHATKKLINATKQRNYVLVNRLLDICHDLNVDGVDSDGYTALIWAVRKDDVRSVKLLLERNANPNAKTNRNVTALHWAIKNQSLPATELLFQKYANPNAQDKRGRTPLHLVAKRCLLVLGEKILISGGNPNLNNRQGQTPTHLAAKECKVNLLNALKNADVDVETRDAKGRTPLHYAAKWNDSIEAVRYLLEDMSANIHAKDQRGRTVIHFSAAHTDNLEILKTFMSKVRRSLDDDFWKDNGGRIPLHYAAMSQKNPEIISFLVNKFLGCSACSEARDYRGRTPLHHAAIKSNDAAWEILWRDLRVNRNARDYKGNAALVFAKKPFDRCRPLVMFVSGLGENWASNFHASFSDPFIEKLRDKGINWKKLEYSASRDWFVRAVSRTKDDFFPVILISYSWGGETATKWINYYFMQYERVGESRKYFVNPVILVTLDPVSWFGHDGKPTEELFLRPAAREVLRWVNVYTTGNVFAKKYPLNYSADVLARLGNRWKYSRYADKNIGLGYQYKHNEWHVMFREAESFVTEEVRKICGSQLDLPLYPSDGELSDFFRRRN